MKLNVYAGRPIQYIKIILFVILVIAEVIICADLATSEGAALYAVIIVAISGVGLVASFALDGLFAWGFGGKIAFLCAENAFLFIMCTFAESKYATALYCIVLTHTYLNFESFTDKLIIFAVCCTLYAISYVSGIAITAGAEAVFRDSVDMISKTLLGLLIMALDFIIVQFLLGFYKTNKNLAEALRQTEESQKQLKSAYDRLAETAVLEERNRIARDMHDNAGHSVTTIIMQTEAAKLLIDTDKDEAKRRIISANMQARNALEQMRESVHLLAGRQPLTTLKEELEGIVAQTVDGTNIKARFDICDAEVSGEIRRLICNALKECISNGVRHGGATAFYIELSQSGGNICLFVSDNGTGCGGQVKMGFGLSELTKKAKELGGSCALHSELGEGFEVTLTVPAKKEGGI